MSNINKKLHTLNKALEVIIGKKELRKISSFQRSIDITSYGRKVLNLFFPQLADELVEMSNNQSKLIMSSIEETRKKLQKLEDKAVSLGSPWGLTSLSEMEEFESRADVPDDIIKKIHSIEDKYHNLMDRQFNQNNWKNKKLKVYLQPQQMKNKIEVFLSGVGEESEKKLINTQDLSIFTDEERKIFVNSGHIFNIHLRNMAGGDDPIRGGAVTGSLGYTVYNPSIFYSKKYPHLLKQNISKLYNDILEFIVHESTHQQQFLLRERVSDLLYDYPELGLLSEEEDADYSPLVTDRGFINYKDKEKVKNWITSKYRFEEEEEELPFLPDELPEETSEDSSEFVHPYEGKSLVEMILYKCPNALSLAKEEIEKNPEQDIMEIAFKYRDACNEERQLNRTEEQSESYHKTTGMSQDNEIKEYYLNPVEIEAHIRGFRSILKGTGKSFATQFCSNIASRFSDGDVLKEVWNAYKEMYKRLNYPEKDLGEDSAALACISKIKNK
jgi:hypothetical protein